MRLKEVCNDIRVKQLMGEFLQHSTTAGNEIRLDISARGFSKASQMAFMYVRVFNSAGLKKT